MMSEDDFLELFEDDPCQDVCLQDAATTGPGRERSEPRNKPHGLARMVPAKLRKELPRNPLLAQRVLAEVVERAKSTTGNHGDAAIRKHISDQWETPEYRFWVRALIEQQLTGAHLARREKDRVVPEIVPRAPPVSGPWKVEGDLGLEFDSVLESVPDEVAVSFASMIVKTSMTKSTQALVLGAGSSAVGLAIDGIERGLGRHASCVQVLEVDAFDWPRGSRCIHGPRFRWDQDLVLSVPRNDEKSVLKMLAPELAQPKLDIVFLTPPCPATGSAAHVRSKYLFDGNEESRTACDPGRYGVKKWSLTVGATLARAVDRLNPRGTVAGLIPLGIRGTFQDATGEFRPGLTYVDSEEPWRAVLALTQDLGLKIEKTIEVTEINPKKVPFVADRRPRYRFFVARKGDK